jgi:hypothetical protein
MTNVPTLSQCQVCQDVAYTYSTKSEDITNSKSRGNFIAIAAKRQQEDMLTVVAGLNTSDLEQTSSISNATGPINGAFWYYVPGKSFGFAGSAVINLKTADTKDTGCDKRLSWHLDLGVGGWRAGCQTGLIESDEWRKIMYACNTKVSCGFSRISTPAETKYSYLCGLLTAESSANSCTYTFASTGE